MEREKRPGLGVGVVCFDRGHVLLGKRKGTHGEGEWSLPGGKIDPNETPQKAAQRELLEETGIISPIEEIKTIPHWSFDSYPDIDRDFVTLYFATPWPHIVPKLNEPEKCEYWEFIKWENLNQLESLFCGLGELSERFPKLAQGFLPKIG